MPPRLYGGTERVIAWLTDELLELGHDVTLFASGDSVTRATLVPVWTPKVSLVDLLAQINVKPEQIKYVGISHYHADHTGQVGSFPKATLLIGKGDWDAISSPKPIFGKSKRAPRIEIMIKRFGAAALKGDPEAAAILLEMRARVAKHGDISPIIGCRKTTRRPPERSNLWLT